MRKDIFGPNAPDIAANGVRQGRRMQATYLKRVIKRILRRAQG